jgi:uncharacterized protein involved in type VI secretion and phage assembly
MKAAFANVSLAVHLDGAPLEAALARSMTRVAVRQRLSAPSLAELSFAEPPPAAVKAFRFGAPLKLGLAAGAGLFAGEITGIEYCRDGAQGRVVRLRAFDKLNRLRKKQRARAVANATVGQFITDTAAEIGLGCDPAESGPARRLIVQYDQSDFDAVTGLAAEAGLYLYLDGETVRVVSLAGEGDPIELKVGRELATARATASVESLRRGTKASAWDVLHTQVVTGSATLARQDALDMHGGDVSAFEGLGERLLFNRLAGAADEAQALAQADLDRGASRQLTIEATADGNAAIRPGRVVSILGVDDAVDGLFAVTEAVHSFTEASGYLTELSTAPPQIAPPPRAPAFTFGQVSNLDDPDRLSRVKAKLGLCGDIETDWMPVVIPGAGADKGLAVMPEAGDGVLIVFPQGDFAYGVVLGGLYGERKSPGLVDAGVRPFAFRTGNGQAITLDAAGGLARMETSGGDVFEIGPKGARLHAVADLVIEAPGRTLTIRAKSVEFEQG